MKRAALLIIPAAALLASVALQHAEARSKAYCRDFAQQVADQDGGAPDVVQSSAGYAVPEQVTGSAAAEGQQQPSSGTMLTGIAGSDQWQQTYRRAYAECRAS